MSEEILYTPEELSQKLKLSKYTVYEMIKRGEIQSHRIGRSLRVTESQLHMYLAQTKQNDNTFDARIEKTDNGTQAIISGKDGDIPIYVNTDLEGKVKIKIKPEDIIISLEPLKCSARNILLGTVIDIQETPDDSRILTLDIGVNIAAGITKQSIMELGIAENSKVYAIFKTLAVIVV